MINDKLRLTSKNLPRSRGFQELIEGIDTPPDSPALLIDEEVMNNNLREMAAFATSQGLALRPHAKTHKCPELSRRQMDYGAVGIAVAKVSEAEVMVNGGIQDIQIANEIVSPKAIYRLAELSKRAKMTVAVDNQENVNLLAAIMQQEKTSLSVLIDVDVGLNRCGLPYDRSESIASLARHIQNQGLPFAGIMCHAGQAYQCKKPEEVAKVGLWEGNVMVEVAEKLRKQGIPCPMVSVGSTPTARYAGTVAGITELRCGTYIFNDAMQVALGTVDYSSCALRVVSTVISVPDKDRAIIDAGSKTLALDRGAHGTEGVQGFGYVIGRKATLVKLSEEHGFLETREQFTVGEKVEIIPNHVCPVVNLAEVLYSPNAGKKYFIEARGCSQ